MRYALTDGSNVVNVIEWDGEEAYEAPFGLTVLNCPPEVSVGWTLASGEFIPPVESEPDQPTEDPVLVTAKNSALAELLALGVSEANARVIVGLPPAE